jgi:hypothetical protein
VSNATILEIVLFELEFTEYFLYGTYQLVDDLSVTSDFEVIYMFGHERNEVAVFVQNAQLVVGNAWRHLAYSLRDFGQFE